MDVDILESQLENQIKTLEGLVLFAKLVLLTLTINASDTLTAVSQVFWNGGAAVAAKVPYQHGSSRTWLAGVGFGVQPGDAVKNPKEKTNAKTLRNFARIRSTCASDQPSSRSSNPDSGKFGKDFP